MKNFKNIYKPMPERFHYVIDSAVKEATIEVKKKSKFRNVFKTVIIIAIIAALATTTVYASSEVYKLIINKHGRYALGLSADKNCDSPEYVKLIAEPDGYIEMKGTLGLKFCKSDSDRVADYSFSLLRPQKGLEELYENVSSYKTLNINGREAVFMKGAGVMVMNRVSVYFEDVNIILDCYVNPQITEQEIIDSLQNVKVVEGNESNYTDYTLTKAFKFEDFNFDKKRYTEITEGEATEVYPQIKSTITNITVVDTAEAINREDFYFWGEDVNEYIASDGSIYPRVSDVWSFGDGVNNTDVFITSEKMDQKLVLADITYVNESDAEYTFSIDWKLEYLKAENSGKLSASDVYLSDRNIGDGFAQYIKNANKGEFYYVYTIEPGETETFTIGYLCDEVLLSDAYLICEKDSSNSSVLSTVKVQNNG